MHVPKQQVSSPSSPQQTSCPSQKQLQHVLGSKSHPDESQENIEYPGLSIVEGSTKSPHIIVPQLAVKDPLHLSLGLVASGLHVTVFVNEIPHPTLIV
jgi:hypothetical protein